MFFLVVRALSLVLLVVLGASSAMGQGTGYWHTGGAQIYDANNKVVRIAGINWYGFETTDAVAHGLNLQDYKSILQTLKTQGYNTIRVPFSNQMVETPSTNLNISYGGGMNADLQGLNSLQVLDKIVTYAGTIGLKIILDNHRSEAGNSAEGNGLWYTGAYPEANWIADWQGLATRYLGNTTVIGFDLRNEPHNAYSGGSCWDCGGANDWHLAAARGGNAVLAVNAQLLIFVEGTDAYNNDYYWWGGNLEGVAKSPVTLAVANRLVYSAHDYGPNEYGQSWFNGDSAASLAATWTTHWAYISQQQIAPIWLGEFGTENSDSDVVGTASGSQGLWFSSLVGFLKANPALNWTYWALNGEDSYGLLDANYDSTPPDALKQTTLATIQFPLSITGMTAPTVPSAPVGLTAAAVSASQIALAWTPSSTAGVVYSIFFGTNAGSIGTMLAKGVSAPAYQATSLNPSTTYYFTVTASSAIGNSGVSNTASATTQAAGMTAAPTGLSANAVSASQINLAWLVSASPNATYSVYSGTSPGAITSLLASGLAGTSFAHTGLNPSTIYYYAVAATATTGTSALSAAVSATTLAAAATAAPAAPFGLSASPASASQINLSWQPSKTAGVTYSVYAGTVTGATNTLVGSGLAGTSFSVTALLDGTSYFFTVKAFGSGGSSVASNQASATTQTLPAGTPTGLTAIAASSSQIALSWTAVVNTGASYSVYYGASSGAENTLLAGGIAGTSYVAASLAAGTTYCFVVRSVSGGGTSSPSAQAGATTLTGAAPVVPVTPVPPVVPVVPVTPTAPAPPAAPTVLVASAASASQINLTWTASSAAGTTAGVTYSVYGGTAAGGETLLASGIGATAYWATGLASSTAYFYIVKAVSGGTTSAASNEASATTQAAAAGGCSVAYVDQADWQTGFTGALAITNTGSKAWTSWAVTWTFGGNQQIYQSWSGNYTQNGVAVSIVNAGWNGTVAPGGMVTGIGWNANYSGTNGNPTAFQVNGVACH